MLRFVENRAGWLRREGKISERACCLFGVACCRRFWGVLTSRRARQVVETAERFADGLASLEDLKEVRDVAQAVWHDTFQYTERTKDTVQKRRGDREAILRGAQAAYCAVHGCLWGSAKMVMQPVAGQPITKVRAESLRLANLVRCVLGNPFCPLVIDLAWRTPNVLTLAQAACGQYLPDEQEATLEPVSLAVLADALEEAGGAGEVMEHLRNPGPHVRGCHVLDAILGRR
jgi:hypothetical protein